MDTTRVSSNWTLGLKIFIPTTWIVFFGSLTIYIAMNGFGQFQLPIAARAGAVGIYLVGLLLLYVTLLRLKRVELSPTHFYVTNYFKTYRYTYDSIRVVKENDYLIFTTVVFKFVEKSTFGKQIYFVRRKKIWAEFIAEHPNLFAHLKDPD